MYSRLLAALLSIVVLPLLALPNDQTSVRVRESELSRTPLFAGPLKITISSLNSRRFVSIKGVAEVKVENTSTAFTIFAPHRLSFVDRDNVQIDVVALVYFENLAAVDRRIAPGAHTKETYALTGRVHPPAELYYDEKLLAVIVD